MSLLLLSTRSICLAGWIKGIILSHFYFWLGWVGPCENSVSPRSKSFFFPFLGDFYSTWWSVGTGAWTRTRTRAWQLIISWWWWVTHVIILSAPFQRILFLGFFRLGLDLWSGFGGLLGQGIWDLNLGLTFQFFGFVQPQTKPEYKILWTKSLKESKIFCEDLVSCSGWEIWDFIKLHVTLGFG